VLEEPTPTQAAPQVNPLQPQVNPLVQPQVFQPMDHAVNAPPTPSSSQSLPRKVVQMYPVIATRLEAIIPSISL
jgi:hypothetical protein